MMLTEMGCDIKRVISDEKRSWSAWTERAGRSGGLMG